MNGDRLTPLDASFLHLEDDSAHMHVASVMLFDGEPPPYDELVDAIEAPAPPGAALSPAARLRAVLPGPPALGRRPAPQPSLPRARHRAAEARYRGPAASAGEPRAVAAARPRQAAVGDLAGPGRRGRPLRRASPRPTTRWSTASPAWTSSRSCSTPRPSRAAPAGPGERWLPRPLPGRAQLLGEALLERATVPAEVGRTRAGDLPHAAPDRLGRERRARGRRRHGLGGPEPGPGSPYNGPIGPHRRFTWVRAELGDLKAIKNELGGTVNDVVLATVPAGCGGTCDRRGVPVDDGLDAQGDGPRERARRRRARCAREQGGGDDGAAAGGRRRRRGAHGPHHRAHGRAEEVRPGRGRAGAHRSQRLRRRRRS